MSQTQLLKMTVTRDDDGHHKAHVQITDNVEVVYYKEVLFVLKNGQEESTEFVRGCKAGYFLKFCHQVATHYGVTPIDKEG